MTTLPSRPPLYRFYCWSDSDFAFEWILPLILWCCEANLLQPIRGTTQIWAVIRHQYTLHPFFRRQFAGKSVGRRLFSKALLFREGPGGPAPLIFRPKWGPKGGKKFFWRPPPPHLYQGLDDRPTPAPPPPPFPLIWRSGFATDSCIYFSVNPRRKQSWTSPKSLKLPLQFVAHSFHQV